MLKYIARRLILAVPLIFGIVTATFFLAHLAPGDPVVVLPSGRRTEVAEVLLHGTPIERGIAGQSLTLTLADEVDVSRGDMLVHAEQLPRVGEQTGLT